MMNKIEELQQRYTWSAEEPGPEKVVQQAKERNVDLDELIEKMDDPNGTGWERWKWYRNYAIAFGGLRD
jgi:hypothetical protein